MLKVSIIIPVYKAEKYIEKCARSVFEQTYSNLEIVFVNDCTPDNSLQVIKDVLECYPVRKSQVAILYQEVNKGVAAARKKGLDYITGDYCIQFDSDDFVDSTMIESLVEVAEKENSDIVFCDYNLVTNNIVKHIHVNPKLQPIECMKQLLKCEIHGSLWNKLIRLDLYRNHDVQFMEGLNMREDFSVMYRLLYYAKRLAYVPKPLYNYVLRVGSVSDGRMNAMQQRDTQNLLIEMDEFCAKSNITDQNLIFAFFQFKAQVKTGILLFGNIKELKTNLYKGIRIQHYCSHPILPFPHKIMGILSESHFMPLVWAYRKIVDILLSLK